LSNLSLTFLIHLDFLHKG